MEKWKEEMARVKEKRRYKREEELLKRQVRSHKEKERWPQPHVDPSVFVLCHPRLTTTNLSCRCPILETSATLCGNTGAYIIRYIDNILYYQAKRFIMFPSPRLGSTSVWIHWLTVAHQGKRRDSGNAMTVWCRVHQALSLGHQAKIRWKVAWSHRMSRRAQADFIQKWRKQKLLR